jgi:hypothetical protein
LSLIQGNAEQTGAPERQPIGYYTQTINVEREIERKYHSGEF